MKSISGDEIRQGYGQEPGAHEDKIFVSVRVRPLNEKEIAKSDSADWECVNDNSIICKNSLTERSLYPAAYTFDRVHGCDSTTRQVYEDGVKRVALSGLNGINSSIFAYGQTSSGKTYTMTGITQYAISDIFDYIEKQDEREFVLKFSAIEIYNECVRDLLSADGTPLRLLDDPEKGTVIDKLTEIPLTDWTHLMELLAVCEAQRKIGETSLNEMSSRSHQIIRLTIESSPSEFSGMDSASTLTATVNFVDLAGSERASQTLSAGTRLKEGCHINRSLLTLGTVIRKLSKGRNGHVPYRDSKLTRILQNSLGGNARTAIVCTLSPAHTHLEQSRNTLLFAVCAKEVRTSAQVNVVMSEKALVKQLQREMLRLENELRSMSQTNNSEAHHSETIIKEKELQIQQMQDEIKELINERDLARSRLEEILRAAGIDQSLLPWVDSGHLHSSSWASHSPSVASATAVDDPYRSHASVNTYSFPEKHQPHIPNDDQYFFDDISPSQFMNQYFIPDPSQQWEQTSQKSRTNSVDSCKEVQCIEKDPAGNTDDHVEQSPRTSAVDVSYSRTPSITRSTSCSAIIEGDTSPASEKNVVAESITNKESEEDASERTISQSKSDSDITNKESEVDASGRTISQSKSDSNITNKESEVDSSVRTISQSKSDSDIITLRLQNLKNSAMSVDEKEMHQTEGDISVYSPSKTLERVMTLDLKGKYDYLLGNATPKAIESGDAAKDSFDSDDDWALLFENQRRKIIKLWDECNIPLLHRTYFFSLIKGDPSDAVYIEVELRRLNYLKKRVDQATSERALNLERAILSRKLLRKFSSTEREDLFEEWGIDLESRNRRVQLSQLLWSKTDDVNHARDSAEIVAKLVGLVEQDETPTELFGLSVAPKRESQNILSAWRDTISLLRY